MSLFDVIKYPLSYPAPTKSELEALPTAFFEEYKRKAGFIQPHDATSVSQTLSMFHATEATGDIALLRKMLADREEESE